jgi:hypothetical protein
MTLQSEYYHRFVVGSGLQFTIRDWRFCFSQDNAILLVMLALNSAIIYSFEQEKIIGLIYIYIYIYITPILLAFALVTCFISKGQTFQKLYCTEETC